MHPHTRHLLERSLYDLWLDTEASGDDVYEVYQVGDAVLVEQAQVTSDPGSNRKGRDLGSFGLTKFARLLEEVIERGDDIADKRLANLVPW